MLRLSTALTSNFTAVIPLLQLDTSGPMVLGLSKGETSSDTFELWGTLDSTATDAANAQALGTFAGVSGTILPAQITDQARSWPYVFAQRTAGVTAGTLYATGNQASNPAVVSTVASSVGLYTTVIDLTAFSPNGVRLGGDKAMLSTDIFDVFVTQDSTVTSSVGCYRQGRIMGGGGNGPITTIVKGWPYAIVQRVAGTTAGNILAAGTNTPAVGPGTFATVALASAYPVTGLPDGTVFYTAVPRAMKLSLITSSATPDGIFIFATPTSGRVLQRDITFGSPGSILQTTWYISSLTSSPPGNDDNAGTITAPLLSFNEATIRFAGQYNTLGITFNVTGVLTAFADRLSVTSRNGAGITITGVRSYTGAVTGTLTLVNWDSTTKTECSLTLGSGSWAALVGKPIEFTSGAANRIAWITVDLGGGVALSPGPYNIVTGAPVTGASSETFTSYTQPSIPRLDLEVLGHTTLTVRDVLIQAISFSAPGTPFFYGCNVSVPDLTPSCRYFGCKMPGGRPFGPGVIVDSMSSDAAFQIEQCQAMTFTGQNLCATSSGVIAITVSEGGSLLINGALAIYGSANGVRANGSLLTINQGSYFWGRNMAGPLLSTFTNFPSFYTTAANIGLVGTTPTHFYEQGILVSPTFSNTLPFAGCFENGT